MPTVTIDGKEIEVEAGITLIQACEQAGVEIPRFCYHEKLAIAGNCRMCLVEVEKSPKPVASCAMPVADKMVVHTNTPSVKKAREGVLEFLLINHPLDCPICDQGGECDLQDQTMAYGKGASRYEENKRAVSEKYMGPLVKTAMTRCIHCTRCIRFITDVAGVPELGAVGRGEHMEVTTYVEKALSSELSGNIVDLCPVGALTSAPYAFAARPWELVKTESIDVLDAVGSAIRVDSRGAQVLRVLPRSNDAVNEEWISDKTRHACDGLRVQRLDRPYVRKNGKLAPASWKEALEAARSRLGSAKGEKIAAIAGDLVDVESAYALKILMRALGSPNTDCRQDGAKISTASRGSYLFNTTIEGIDRADLCLIIGSNPRIEAPVLNARIRKSYLRGLQVYVIGGKYDLTYNYEHAGSGPEALQSLLKEEGKLAEAIKKAKNPMLILGQGAIARADGEAVLGLASEIAEKYGFVKEGWNGFNMLHMAGGRVGALDAGFVPEKGGRDVEGVLRGAEAGEIEAVYLLGADEIDASRLKKAFVIYQGHHGDKGAAAADVVLPGAAYTEKDALYVNTEGRVQRAFRAVFPPGEAKDDREIIASLAKLLGKDFPADLTGDLIREFPHFGAVGEIASAEWKKSGKPGAVLPNPFASPIANFYMTDPISRSSKTMAECTAAKAEEREAA